MTTDIKLVACDAQIDVPESIAMCPICGAKLAIEIREWSELPEGGWVASDSGTFLSCSTEPDIDDKGWRKWFNWHFSRPYTDYLPLQAPVLNWLEQNYRFDVKN